MSLCRAALGFLLLLVVCLVCVGSPQTHAQQKVPAPASQTPPIRVTTSLVLVDVLVEDKKTGEPIKDLEEKDFLLHDDRKAASISGFSSGKNQNLRPLQLWFVMACNEARLYPVTTGRVTQDQRTEI